MRYRIPPMAPVLQWMIDTLQVPDTSHWPGPAQGWSVRTQTYCHRFSGWMARLVSLPMLAQALLPEWQARWQQSLAHWSGMLCLTVGEEQCTLQIDRTHLQLVDQASREATIVRLSPQLFTQLVFGYRSVAFAVQEQEQPVAGDALRVLSVLFPTGHAWIPGSDWF
jgi:hypothetical protein